MNARSHDHHDDAPGRIPESLIHAALDGEVSDEMQREIANALNYDKSRRQEFLDTADAINALRLDVDVPDFAGSVLGRLDRQDRFIPASWQRIVRNSRLGLAAGLLLALVCVAGLQRVYPRLSTIGVQDTPLRDVAQAVETDADQVQQCIVDEAMQVRAALLPSPRALVRSNAGRTDFNYEITNDQYPQIAARSSTLSGGFRVMTLPSGYLVYLPASTDLRSDAHVSGRSTSTVSWSRGFGARGWGTANLLGSAQDVRFPVDSSGSAQEPVALELP